jgi:hypothetical protein
MLKESYAASKQGQNQQYRDSSTLEFKFISVTVAAVHISCTQIREKLNKMALCSNLTCITYSLIYLYCYICYREKLVIYLSIKKYATFIAFY